ncbi:hypothetical protein ACFYS8_02745 [Kitasatospora sp. NPDC004615]|uniref:hypothetical protein n=1 Tax=Kitasatospora sp. NPDC004615 TaxID=3364017 RepID=UPI003696F4FC
MTVLFALSALAAAGCSAGRAAPPPAPVLPATAGPTPTASPADVDTLQLPITEYMLTAQQEAALKWLNAKKVAVCMQQYGFDVPVARAPVVSASDSIMFRRYGVTDPASVSTWGYHLPRREGKALQAALSSAENAVLLGRDAAGKPVTSSNGQAVPDGGCQGKANAELSELQSAGRGSNGAGAQLVGQTKGDSFAHSMADPRVQEAFGKWSECLRGGGFDAKSPVEAAENLPSMKELRPDADEIRMAQADVDCKARTNLVGIWFAVEADYQKGAIAQQPQAFGKLKAERDAQAARIDELVKGLTGR